jgi:hypothetical protein
MVSSRAKLIIAVSLLSGVWSQAVHSQASTPASFDIMDATIEGIHTAMKSGSLSCVALVQGYLARIKALLYRTSTPPPSPSRWSWMRSSRAVAHSADCTAFRFW